MSSSNSLGSPFVELPTVDSTNNYAIGMIHEGMARHGTAVFSHEQTMGKGQRNKSWQSEKDQNIALSIIIQPEGLKISDLFLLSMMVANAAYDFFNNYDPGNVYIKWPNDIYWCDRKAGGILIENVLNGIECSYAVLGIGFNINQTVFKGLEGKAVSLKQITGKSYDPVLLAKELCVNVQANYLHLFNNRETIRNLYKSRLYKLNQEIQLKSGNRVFKTLVKDVTTDGKLVVGSTVEEEFSVGEIEWV